MTPDKILEEAAETFREKNKVYKSNYKEVGGVLSSLFPNGIELKCDSDFIRFQFLVMIAGKLTRYTNNWDKGGHQDSVRDLTVYASLLESYDAEIEEPQIPIWECDSPLSPEQQQMDFGDAVKNFGKVIDRVNKTIKESKPNYIGKE